jgi:hypothetical protein
MDQNQVTAFNEAILQSMSNVDFMDRHGDPVPTLEAITAAIVAETERIAKVRKAGKRPNSRLGTRNFKAEAYRRAQDLIAPMDLPPRTSALAYLLVTVGSTRYDVVDFGEVNDVADLCAAIEKGLVAALATENHALEAFAEAFAGAHLRIANRNRALERHAAKKQILKGCWDNYKKGDYESIPKAAAAYAAHYKGEVTERAFIDYFRAQTKAEGGQTKPGRKRKKTPK